MFRVMNYETMMTELANHKQTKDLPKDDLAYFAKTATVPENFDTILCYLEQDKQNAVLYTKKMFAYLAQKDGVKLVNPDIYMRATNAIIDIFNHHIIDVSTFVDIRTENDVADALLQMKDQSRSPSNRSSEAVNISLNIETEEPTPTEPEVEYNDIIEKKTLIKRQLKKNKKKASKKYIQRAAEIYDEIEDYLLKCRPNKKIHKLFGTEFTKKTEMDTIISSIKQIVTNCDDDSEKEQETETHATIGEQVSNHISGFTLERNIVAPISDISYAVKQHLVTSSINNINTIESYTAGIDNAFVQAYVNQTLRNMRNKCIAHIG